MKVGGFPRFPLHKASLLSSAFKAGFDRRLCWGIMFVLSNALLAAGSSGYLLKRPGGVVVFGSDRQVSHAPPVRGLSTLMVSVYPLFYFDLHLRSFIPQRSAGTVSFSRL